MESCSGGTCCESSEDTWQEEVPASPPASRAAFRDQGRDREDDPYEGHKGLEGDHEEYHSSGWRGYEEDPY